MLSSAKMAKSRLPDGSRAEKHASTVTHVQQYHRPAWARKWPTSKEAEIFNENIETNVVGRLFGESHTNTQISMQAMTTPLGAS